MMNHTVKAVVNFVYSASPAVRLDNINWLKLGHPTAKVSI